MKKTIFIFTMILMSFVFVACGEEESTTSDTSQSTFDYKYSDYAFYQVKNFDQQLNYQDGTYYVYYYSEGCGGCQAIKEDVLSIIAYLEEDTLLLFDVYQSPQIPLEPSIGLKSTPSLVKISDNQSQEVYVGSSDILPILEQLK